jgi:hypothetical protein
VITTGLGRSPIEGGNREAVVITNRHAGTGIPASVGTAS